MDSLISSTVPAPTQLCGRQPTQSEIDIFNSMIKPKLFQLAIMIKDGACETEVLDFLCLSRNELNAYKQMFPELSNAVNQGKLSFVEQAEKTLFKAATGQMVTEVEEIESYSVDDNGEEKLRGRKIHRSHKFIPPQVKALEMLLTNRASDRWKKSVPTSIGGSANVLQINATKEDVDSILQKLGDPLSCLKLADGSDE